MPTPVEEIVIDPKDETIKVWRYLDFTKFVSMLLESSVYFANAEVLGDKWEGVFPRGNLDYSKPQPWMSEGPSIFDPEVNVIFRQMYHATVRDIRAYTFISCWHANNDESAAMWKLYAEEKNSICVQTTYKILKEVLTDSEAPGRVVLGQVVYKDFKTFVLDEKKAHYDKVFFLKRKSFEHENEIRALFYQPPKNPVERSLGLSASAPISPETRGHHVKVDLSKLIQSIYVSPTSPSWFLEVVRDIVKKYSFDPTIVRQSDLEQDPLR